MLLVTPGVWKPWWLSRLMDTAGPRWLGLWGRHPQDTHTMEGAGPGSRPSEASGSSTLLRSGTRHARVMQGVAWGCTGSFQRAGGSPSGGALTRSRRHPAERPRVGSGPSPAVTGGDSAGPPKVRQSEGPAVTSAREYRTWFEEIRQRHGLVTNTKEDALPPSPTGGWLPGSRTAGVEGVGTADAGGDIGGRGAGPERGPHSRLCTQVLWTSCEARAIGSLTGV